MLSRPDKVPPRSQVGSFLHSTTSGRWEDVIASAPLPPPVGGGENPIWSKSVESRDGARIRAPCTAFRAHPPLGRRALPGTVIGPAPWGQPRAEPSPAAGPLPLLSAVPAAPPRACFSPLPYLRPLPKSLRSARSPEPSEPPPAFAPRPCGAHPREACLCTLLQTSPHARSPCSPFGFSRRPSSLAAPPNQIRRSPEM